MLRIPAEEFRKLDLSVHEFLEGVPLHDVSAIDLPGGGDGRTLQDVRELLPGDAVTRANPVVAALFRIRFTLGRLLGWDSDTAKTHIGSYRQRLPEAYVRESLVAPGTADGPARLLYLFPHEALAEVRNATVHAFLCSTLQPAARGYRLYWAVYVLPTSRLTPIYMAAIDPFRRWIVYPGMLARLRRAWVDHYAPSPA